MPKVSKKNIPKIHMCPVCGKGYTQSGTRNRHLKTKHGEDHELVSPANPGESKPKSNVSGIIIKHNPNMIRNIVREPYYTTDRFPECIFEKNIDLFYTKRDEYLQSGAAIYDKDVLFELRRKAGNAESAAVCREKKKNYKMEAISSCYLFSGEGNLIT